MKALTKGVVAAVFLCAACGEPQQVVEREEACGPVAVVHHENRYIDTGSADGLGIELADIVGGCGDAQVTSITVGLYLRIEGAQGIRRVPLCDVLSCSEPIALRTTERELVPTMVRDIYGNGADGISYQQERDGGTFPIPIEGSRSLWMQLGELAPHTPVGLYVFVVEVLEVAEGDAVSQFEFLVSPSFAVLE
ncbi:MAG: hypothetical protein Q7S96_02015 [bacterium]|nr:hypothetical protein [bacterium]